MKPPWYRVDPKQYVHCLQGVGTCSKIVKKKKKSHSQHFALRWLIQSVVLTLSASPSCDVTGVVVGQDVARGRDGTQLDVVVEGSLRRETQQSNVIPNKRREGETNIIFWTVSFWTHFDSAFREVGKLALLTLRQRCWSSTWGEGRRDSRSCTALCPLGCWYCGLPEPRAKSWNCGGTRKMARGLLKFTKSNKWTKITV